MKLVFRPFGVGVEDVDSKDLARHGKVAVDKVVEQAVWCSLVAIGLGLIAGKALASKTADVLLDASEALHFAGNKVVDFRDFVIVPALAQNGQDKIDHSWSLTEDNSIIRLDALIADVKARNEAI
jgi:hypothetical protein